MSDVDRGQLTRFAAKFNRWVELDHADVGALLDLPWQAATVARGSSIEPKAKRLLSSTVIVEGTAACYVSSFRKSGAIVALHFPGDLACPRDTFLGYEAAHLVAVTETRTATIPQSALVDLARSRPAIGLALWRQSLVDSNIMRRWLFNVTQLNALERLAHFLCEIVVRQEEAGLPTEPVVTLPFSQGQIGEAVGLTPVHVNRMLKQLRSRGLVEVNKGSMLIIDWVGLRDLCSFDPKYLGIPPSASVTFEKA